MSYSKCFLYLFFCFGTCCKEWLYKRFAFRRRRQISYAFESFYSALVTQPISRYSQEMTPSVVTDKTQRYHRISSSLMIDQKPLIESFIFQTEDLKEARRTTHQRYQVDLIDRRGRRNQIDYINDIQIDGYKLKVNGNNLAVLVLQPLIKKATDLVIIHSHQNQPDLGVLIDHYLDLCYNLRVTVIGYDYPGYGLSQGQPTEQNIYDSIRAVYEFTLTFGFETQDIILYGQSLGSGPSIDLASQLRVRGLILQGAFTKLLDVLHPHESNNIDIFNNISKMPQVVCPVMFIHGTDDTITPLFQADRLKDATPNLYKFWTVLGAGHNNIETNLRTRQMYFNELINFVQYLSNS